MGTQKVLVAGSNVSASQLKDLFRQFEDGSLNGDHLQALLDHQNPFEPVESENILAYPDDMDWRRVYRELGLEAEFLAALPTLDREAKENLWWVPVIKGVRPNLIVARFRGLKVQVYTYADDLDQSVPTNDRDSNRDGSYVARFRQTIEADPELANKSADDLAKEGVKGITLTERLLLELGLFVQIEDHLDKQNVTLCSGSRGSGGDVPRVDWSADSRELCVYWSRAVRRHPGLRTRAVVS